MGPADGSSHYKYNKGRKPSLGITPQGRFPAFLHYVGQITDNGELIQVLYILLHPELLLHIITYAYDTNRATFCYTIYI